MSNKTGWVFAILINVLILGSIAIVITGMAIGNLALGIAGFVCAGVVGIFATVFKIVFTVKNLSPKERQVAEERLGAAKKMFSNMTKKEKLKFILLTVAIVSSLACTVVFGRLNLIAPMFFCIAVFIGIGVVGAIMWRYK